MASVQSYFIKYWLRQLKVFAPGRTDLHLIRERIERAGNIGRKHKNVAVVPIDAASVPSEWLIPSTALNSSTMLYIHGGAWFMGSTHTHRAFISHLTYESEIRALSINYRLAPEYPFPAGLEDCITAYKWLLQGGIPPNKIVVAGDSAGGNLALALLVALRDQGITLPACAVAISPATDLALTGDSLRTRLHLDPIFSKAGPNTIIQGYIANYDPRHPLISPLYADLHGLPPLLIHVGDHETLLDDAVRFGERAAAAGVEVNTVVWPEMFHVFQIFTPVLPEARRAVKQIAMFIRSRISDNATNAQIE